MKPRRKLIVSSLMCLLLLAIASGTVLVRSTAAAYCGVCDSLDGFPGVLQKAGFVPRGHCRDRDRNDGDHDRDDKCVPKACVTDPDDGDKPNRKGHCARREIREKHFCVCVPNRISK
jgi:hypothetical protein